MSSLRSTPPVHFTPRIWAFTCAALGCPRCCSPATPPPVWSKAPCGTPETRITIVSWCGTAVPPPRCRSMTPAWTLSFPAWHGWPVWMRSSTPSAANLHSWRPSARLVRRFAHQEDPGGTMKYGLFMMPSHPPERNIYDAHQWDLDYLALCESLGYDEAWIGEHFTSPWEPIPAPDIMIAQALMRTKRIKLGTGAHLLPFHHPAELAHRVAYLDHLAQGRFLFGVGSSGLPSDWGLFNIDGNAGQHRDMTREALDIILKLWESEKPFRYEGKFWTVNYPDAMYADLRV